MSNDADRQGTYTADGYIYTIVGKGSYAAKRNKELIREEYLCRIERHLEKVTELAKSIGLSNKESKLL